MTSERQPAVIVTTSTELAADHLRQGETVVLPFAETNKGMQAWFAPDGQEGRTRLAQIKGRESGKAFVHTTDAAHRELLLDHPHIHNSVSDEVKGRVAELLRLGSTDRPIGVLLPAAGEFGEHNVSTVTVSGEVICTVGFMVSGPSRVYSETIAHLNGDANGVLAGTSANFGGRKEANGSGHHNVWELVRDFQMYLPDDASVVVVVPRPDEYSPKTGPSTTTTYVDTDGNGWLVREGSLPAEEMVKIMEQAGIPFVGKVDAYKKIQSYEYDSSQQAYDTRHLKEDLLIRAVNRVGTIKLQRNNRK